MSRAHFIASAVGLICLFGCSGDPNRLAVYPVSGAVYVRGEPAIGARVFLSPAENPTNPRALRPFAVVDTDGSFRLTTYKAFDGAPVGDYVVIIAWPVRQDGAPGNDEGAISTDRLKNAYGDPSAPKLRATVKPEPNALEPFRLN